MGYKGKGLEPLCDGLERIAIERIRLRPEKYLWLGKNEGLVEDIEIKNLARNERAYNRKI
jgi:hypothetical protein